MTESTALPWKIRLAANGFRKHRADYYDYAASVLKSSGGKIKILELFDKDIERFKGKPRGILAAWWHDTYSANGGNLADTFQGTLPDDEVAIIRVSQDAGGDAVIVALADVARMAKLSDQVRSEALGTVAAGLIGVVIAASMLTAFPMFSVRMLVDSYAFLPIEAWGPMGRKYHAYAQWVEKALPVIAAGIGLMAWLVLWSFSNLVGPVRETLDRRFGLYSVARDLRGALFLATMSTLTKPRSGVMFTLKGSLDIFWQSARSPWLKWRINQVIEGADQTGAIGVGAFQTGFLSEDMYYFLEDMQQAKGFEEAFAVAGVFVEGTLLKTIVKRMTFYRWLLLMSSLAVALGIFGWQFQVIYEMRGAMSSYLASG
jgi:hypothetical protein